jgi:hypothetical protein
VTRQIKHEFCEYLCRGSRTLLTGVKRNIAILFFRFGYNLTMATKNHRVIVTFLKVDAPNAVEHLWFSAQERPVSIKLHFPPKRQSSPNP